MGMAEAPPQVNIQEARTFAGQFVHDPAVLTSMAEPDVIAYHGKVKGVIDTHVQEAIKARGEFGPNWQKAIAGDDPEALKTVERFKEPKELFKSYSELRTKLSKGELKATTAYPDKGTPEQQAAWRAEQGIPAKPEEYKVELAKGQVLGEEDKPIVDSFLKAAHGANLPPQAVNAAVQWFLNHRDEQVASMAEANKTLERDTEDALRKDFGDDFRGRINNISGLLDATIPEGAAETMRPLIDNTIKRNPDFARWLDNMSQRLNPHGALVPGDPATQVNTIADELTKFDKMMRTNRPEYNKPANSQRYGQLLEEYQRIAKKAWTPA